MKILLAAAALAAALAGTVTAAPAHAADAGVPVSAQPTHTGGTGPLVLAGRHNFPAGPALVSARLTARVLPGGNPHLMLAGVLTCGGQTAVAGINLTTGAGWVLPRHIMTDPTNCVAYAQSALGRTSLDVLRVTVTWSAQPVMWSRTAYRGTAWPTLVNPGKAYDAVPLVAQFPAAAGYVKVRADFRSTACSGGGGSRENGSPYLCTPANVNLWGTQFRLRLIAAYGRAGHTCATTVLSTRTIRVDRWLHHAQSYGTGLIPRGCSSTVRVKLRVDRVIGAPLVVNSTGTVIDLLR